MAVTRTARTPATPGAPEPEERRTYTVDELAARAGLTVRTVRFYATRGLLPPPRIGPRRVGLYGPGHLARLALVDDLRRQGLTLAAIERYVARLPEETTAYELAIHRAMVASWLPDAAVECGRAEAEERIGRSLGADELGRLAAMGVLTPVPGAGERYVLDTVLVGLAVRLLDLPMSREAIASAREVLLRNAARTAHELSEVFRGEVGVREAGEARSLSAHMQPLVLQALLTAFQRSLNAELRGAFPAGGTAREGEPDAD
ncbi:MULTISPECIES: MerR family transcriptional regulator [unclassified Streptomyces]|uniref:MerR family transcriptional regulator n=1 Tax=unclassified Streptomyces TaxID=2593676 RepID=UPI00081EB08D|nr:MerR family transcriptional regulator [Streptomyces sp. LcepLS]MYR26223.1 MerR family transcriptional regulator [Streptomyces sp. SID4945]SCE98306.1 DNA-binding transcriptional regulator, MerR family [Streptomyces sp. LcepLS]